MKPLIKRANPAYVGAMKRFAAALVFFGLTALPAQTQEEEGGFSLMEEGAKLFFKGIIEQMEPTMKDMQGFLDRMQPQLRQFVEEMGPALGKLLEEIDDISAYHPPEILPNGDIIMRRKTPDEIAAPPEGEIEL